MGSFLQRAFAGAGDKVGNDFLKSAGAVSKLGLDVSNIVANSPLGDLDVDGLASSLETAVGSIDTGAITDQLGSISQSLPKNFSSLPSLNSLNLPI